MSCLSIIFHRLNDEANRNRYILLGRTDLTRKALCYKHRGHGFDPRLHDMYRNIVELRP